MSGISFVFPNINSFNSKNSRGRLLNRWEKAKQYNFDFVEVPANFVKDTETEFLGLSECKFLTTEAINKLYPKDDKLPISIKYIFHNWKQNMRFRCKKSGSLTKSEKTFTIRKFNHFH